VTALKIDTLRCLRYGALVKLLRLRCGQQLPDDDAGREYLWELMCIASLASRAADKKLAHVLELWAPWMDAEEAEMMVEHIQALTVTERNITPEDLGRRLRLTNAEREACGFWTAHPVDMSAEDLKEFKKAKRRTRMSARRAKKGGLSRAAYLVKCKATPKPWVALGMSRATYFRRRKHVRRGPLPVIVTSEAHTQSQGHQGRALDRSQLNIVSTKEPVNRPGGLLPHELVTDPVSLSVPVMDLGPAPGTDLVSARAKLDNLSDRLKQWAKTPDNWLRAIKLSAAA
jgi:hypothetical protein